MKTNLPLSAVIAGLVVLGSTVALGEGAPLLIFGPLAIAAGVVCGWQLDRRYLPVFVVVVCFTVMFTSLFHDQADAAVPYRDGDDEPCVANSEWRAMAHFNNVTRDVIEDRFEVRPEQVNANDYVDPTNPHLYPVAYPVCGRADRMLIINYRITSDAWVWAFRLNL